MAPLGFSLLPSPHQMPTDVPTAKPTVWPIAGPQIPQSPLRPAAFTQCYSLKQHTMDPIATQWQFSCVKTSAKMVQATRFVSVLIE